VHAANARPPEAFDEMCLNGPSRSSALRFRETSRVRGKIEA